MPQVPAARTTQINAPTATSFHTCTYMHYGLIIPHAYALAELSDCFCLSVSLSVRDKTAPVS